jgi:hypothetical protein
MPGSATIAWVGIPKATLSVFSYIGQNDTQANPSVQTFTLNGLPAGCMLALSVVNEEDSGAGLNGGMVITDTTSGSWRYGHLQPSQQGGILQ